MVDPASIPWMKGIIESLIGAGGPIGMVIAYLIIKEKRAKRNGNGVCPVHAEFKENVTNLIKGNSKQILSLHDGIKGIHKRLDRVLDKEVDGGGEKS